ncbi:DUF1501 domain-containing protein [Agrobacterium vitis]|uniref:DUF1501 domain-containing protein n=1 Tax=Agrobacterium vitis TaxID=373 RepID=A0ABD6GID6_AGRVI|nr:DUF1501 domain-containing protein [Agrobacterium vitis]MUO80721.1 DUF1501 domain-containing protein [Agrobacterium vitis]MUO96427.1 DUF1501 domain-containing protein [Agrobacterium vitis]MUP07190.1 DUF1501 domain-containing protein [Agrobacterium vitis]MUZ82077.1 DUF1501 domain-containing protein [Agrobacterium vitis]MVA09809.1 DUF1501 domain-containing protein [Agrobacterium vitis]
MLCENLSPTRRAVLGTSGALFAWAFMPRFAHAAGGRDPRFVTIILRGALDGLTAVPPIGDPDYEGLRQSIALRLDGDKPVLPLDGFFGLHPSMPNFQRLFRANHAAVVHASATAYRERSHFDGQDVLESGFPTPGHVETGWMNRLLEGLPAGDKIAPGAAERVQGLSVGATAPLVIRGKAPVLGWAPSVLRPADGDLAPRLMDLYGRTDPMLSKLLIEGIQTGKIASGLDMKSKGGPGDPNGMEQMARGAARLLAQQDGPRVAALAFEGWDTHAQEIDRLAKLLAGLDKSIAAFEQELGPAWKDTAIIVATEFGRTARINGTDGTDHGTGTTAFLAGGAVRGGRVITDWPGLKQNQLFEGRDLAATTDIRAVIKGMAVDLLGASAGHLASVVFPGSDSVQPMKGLIV